jgi:hypothetical protein
MERQINRLPKETARHVERRKDRDRCTEGLGRYIG